MIQIEEKEIKKHKRLILVWSITLLVLFPAFIVLGMLMRLHQGEWAHFGPNTFYAIMTMHGLGMAGILFSFSAAGLTYLIGKKYAHINVKFSYFIYALFVAGMLLLAYGTLMRGFAAGWYLLYPLPFLGRGAWQASATFISIIALLILGVSWLLQSVQVVYAIAKEYGGLSKIFAFQYLKKEKPKKELPPIVLISSVSLIPGILSYIAAAVMLIMYLMQNLNPALSFDPLLMKNLTFFFGHMIVNITLYCGIGWVYTLLPKYTGREWKLTKVTVIAWLATFIFIIFAYFHHLYMDFAQGNGFQYAGQVASYLSAVPATAVSMFGVIAQLYRSKVKWTVVPLSFLFGCMGWAIGGFAAVVDSTIAMNRVLHDTLWVPAHFHTYLLMGAVLFIFGFLFYLASERRGYVDVKPRFGFWAYVIGSYGFLLMFYLGGMDSVPRRFANYKSLIGTTHMEGMHLAQIAVIFICLLLLGLLFMYFRIFKGLFTKSKAIPEPDLMPGVEV